MQTQPAALPWFEKGDYESFRHVLPDRNWHDTYDDWLRAAEETFERMQRQRFVAFKAHVRSDAFVQWCKDTGRDIENRSLIQFASDYAHWAHSQNETH